MNGMRKEQARMARSFPVSDLQFPVSTSIPHSPPFSFPQSAFRTPHFVPFPHSPPSFFPQSAIRTPHSPPFPQSAFRIPHSKAFTLTELLVSMAILSGLILLMFAVVDGTTQTWTKSEQRVDAFREARAALFIISRDLQTMVPAPDIGPEPYPTPPTAAPGPGPTPTPTPAPTPNGIPDFRYFFVNPDPSGAAHITFSGVAAEPYGDRFFFLTAQPSSAQGTGEKSDICAIGYYLDYTASPNAPNSFKLYRYFKGSNDTFTRLRNYVRNEPPTSVLMVPSSATDEVLARNVVDFRVVAYDRDFKRIAFNPAASDYGKVTPYAVDLSITAYNYSVANRFNNEAAWIAFKGPNPSPDALSHQTFTTRVYLSRASNP